MSDFAFCNGRIVFSDGVSYSIAEALTLADRGLSDDDRQAIHLIKKLFDAEIITQPGIVNSFVNNAICIDEEKVSLDEMAAMFGDAPILYPQSGKETP